MTYTFLELNGTTRRIKRNNAKRLLHSGQYEQIGERTYCAIERRREKRGMEVIEFMPIGAFCEWYGYPAQQAHPELWFVPAMRYPVQMAQQHLTSF